MKEKFEVPSVEKIAFKISDASMCQDYVSGVNQDLSGAYTENAVVSIVEDN